ncbi:unnamed protein product [Gongylonema pulchrum]|uniref:Uncharacterized protein n=1 Tax=Gongylonema pulchrum TaxID=637853 RepID=A0A183DH46_9BILA|nr:unnamed protein product [Gongylonema pulchrum]
MPCAGPALLNQRCDAQLLQVLHKMHQNKQLEKHELENLIENLAPQAPNECVTVALLGQVLQRHKAKKTQTATKTEISSSAE